MPLLDEWYGLVAQPSHIVHHSDIHAALLRSDWNPALRLVLHLRRAPLFSRSEDELLRLAFSPGGVCHSPLGLPVYPDWAKVQQRYLPSKSVEEIRKRFQNVRCKESDERHPLRLVKLHAGARPDNFELSEAEMAAVESAVKEGRKGQWAQLCRTKQFAGWDRRTLKRTYDKCKRSQEQSGAGLESETSNIEPPSRPSTPAGAPPSLPHGTLTSEAPPPPTAMPTAAPPFSCASPAPSADVGGPKKEIGPSGVLCDGGAVCEVVWSRHSDRQLLLFARQHGSAVEQWPYVAVSTLRTTVMELTSGQDANALSIEAIAERLTLLLGLISQQQQQQQQQAQI